MHRAARFMLRLLPIALLALLVAPVGLSHAGNLTSTVSAPRGAPVAIHSTLVARYPTGSMGQALARLYSANPGLAPLYSADLPITGPMLSGPASSPFLLTNLSAVSPSGPAGRAFSQICYDPADHEVVLFSGSNSTGRVVDDTWTYNLTTLQWTNITSLSLQPPPRTFGDMAYDPLSADVILFGGDALHSSGTGGWVSTDTWEFHAGIWSNMTSSLSVSPAPFLFASATTDTTDREIVVAGGESVNGNGGTYVSPMTWTFRNGVWTNLTSSLTVAPKPRFYQTLSDDPADGGALLFGGIQLGGGEFYPDTWLFSAGAWTNVTPSVLPMDNILGSMTYIGANQSVVLTSGIWIPRSISGFIQGPWLWAWHHGAWVNDSSSMYGFPPPACVGSSYASIPGQNGGGIYYGGEYGGTCGSLASSDFELISAPLHVSATLAPTLITAGLSVAFSGNATGGALTVVSGWSFGDGSSTSNGWGTHVYATAGTYTATFWGKDVLGYSASTSFAVTVSADLTASATSNLTAADVGQVVGFTGATVGGAAPVTYAWVFGDGGVSTSLAPSHSFSAPGSFLVRFWANDSVGNSVSSVLTITVAPAPTVSAAGTPTTTTVGNFVTFSATPSGGTGPYTYSWNFGDGSGGTGATPTHAYASAGTFHATAILTDAVGVKATSSSVTVTVAAVPAPVTVAASASPAAVVVGGTITVTATATGGSGTGYTYTWTPSSSGLGCASSTSGTLTCTPTASGNYSVSVVAKDSTGASSPSISVNVAAVKAPVYSTQAAPSSSWPLLALLLIAVLAVVAVLFAVLWATKGRKPKAPASAPAAPAPAPVASMEPPPAMPPSAPPMMPPPGPYPVPPSPPPMPGAPPA